MFKYSYDYKYLKLKNSNLIIAIGVDLSLGQEIYSATSNLLFKDENGDWGHAVGVGKNEETALKSCILEISKYSDIKTDDFCELAMPEKITIENSNDCDILYARKIKNGYDILTNKGLDHVSTSNIIDYIKEKYKAYRNKGIDNIDQKNLENIGFWPIFDRTYEKYDDSIME